MISIAKIRYDLVMVTPQGKKLHLNQFQRSLSFWEQQGELAMSLKVDIQNQKIEGHWLHQLLPLGGQIFVLADWGEGMKEVFRGFIRKWSYRTDPLGHLSIQAYDMLYQFKSKDHRYYKEGTQAQVILKDIADAWGIPLGIVEGPDIELGRKVFQNRSIAGMITEVLEEAKKRGGGEFIFRANQGKVDIIKEGQNKVIYHLGSRDAVINIEDHQDIEDLVTRIKVVGKERKDGYLPITAVLDGNTEFGVLQDIIYQEQFATPAAAKKVAEKILNERGIPRKKRRVSALDIPIIRRGDKVHIQAGTLDGYYIVTSIRHEVDQQTMNMEVKEA